MDTFFAIISIIFSGCGICVIGFIAKRIWKSRTVTSIITKDNFDTIEKSLPFEYDVKFKLNDLKGRLAKNRNLLLEIKNIDRNITFKAKGVSNTNGICIIKIRFECSGEYIIEATSENAFYESRKFKVGIGQVHQVLMISELADTICKKDVIIESIKLKFVDKNDKTVEYHDGIFYLKESNNKQLSNNIMCRSNVDGIVEIKHLAISKSGVYCLCLRLGSKEFALFQITVIIDKVGEIVVHQQSRFQRNGVSPISIKDIQAQVLNQDRIPLSGKIVTLQLRNHFFENIAISTSKSDKSGNIKFDNIMITQAGVYECVLICENVSQILGNISVYSADIVKNIKITSNLFFSNHTGIPVKLPVIEATVHNDDDAFLFGKDVTLSLMDENDVIDRLSGILKQKSSINGIVKFDNIVAHKVGEYNLCLKCEEVKLSLPAFHIAPQGFDIDFESKLYGTSDYWDAFIRSLRISKTENDTLLIVQEGETCQI